MSQVYSAYTGTKPVEQQASADGQEWLSCEVCSLTFKNQQHYSIHCGGTFHANRVAASLRTQQTSTKASLEDPQAFGSSSNPSYWTGMQQAFSYAGPQQHESQKSTTNRSQSGQGQLTASADAYQSQLEYISYPVGKQAKQPADAKTAGGYEGLYGMPGFGWSDMQQDPSKSDYQSQHYPATAQLPDLQQTKGTSSSKPGLHDAWKNYQPQPQAEKDFGSKKPLDYGYSTQDLSGASYSTQKSDVPSWLKVPEPAVQKTESYKSSNKAALYGSHDTFSSDASARGTDREDPWKSASNYEMDVRGQIRRAKEGSYGKAEQPVRSKTRWDTGDAGSRDGKLQSGDDLDRQGAESRRREERDSYGRGSYHDSRESSNSRNSEDSFRKRDSSRFEDARERESRRKQELDIRDGSKRHDESLRRDDLAYKEMSYGTKRTADKREIGSHAEVGKSRDVSSGWDSSYTGEVNSAGYTTQRDASFSSKAGRNENALLRDQGFANRAAAGKPDTQQFGQTEWNAESWEAYGQGWQTKAPDASSQTRKSLQGAETLGQKTGYDQQRKTSWGGETVQGKNDTSWMQAEGSNTWDAAYASSAASGGVSWSGAPGYTSAGFLSKDGRNEKTLAQGRADKGSWNQKELEKNSSGQPQAGNTWPTTNSGRGLGSDVRRNSGTAGDQEWHSVNDVLSKFKQASKKEPGQKLGTDVGSSAYGDLNQGLSSYTTRPLLPGKTGQRTSDPKSGYDWNWTHVAEDKQQEFGVAYNEQEYATSTDPYHQGASDWGGNYSDGAGGFPQPGLSAATKAGQKVAQANQWTGWPDKEQRGSGAFAKDQQASQPGGLGRGRGQSGLQETNRLGRGVGFGRSQATGIEKPVGVIKSIQKPDRAEKQDWAQSFQHGGQSLLGEAPGASASAENASWFRAQEASGATSAGRGGGRGVVGNKPTPQPGEIGGWRQGFQDQSKLSVGAGRGGPVRGSELSLGQRNSWGFGGTGVTPTASPTKGFEKGQESKAPSNLFEKMRQFSEQSFTRDWSEKGKDLQESRNSVRTSVAAPGQRANQGNISVAAPGQRGNQGNISVAAPGQRATQGSSSVAAVGQRANQSNSSVAAPGQRANQSNSSVAAPGQRASQSSSSIPSLLNLNVAPTGKSLRSDGPEDKYSRDAANSKQKSGGAMQPPSSAFSGKKPEQSPSSNNRMSGSAMMPPVSASSRVEFVAPSASSRVEFVAPSASSRVEFVAPSTGKSVSSNINKPQQAVQPAAASVPAQKALTPKQALLPTPAMLLQSQNKQNISVEAATKTPPGPAVKASGGPGEFDPLDPASARKTVSTGDNKQKVVTALSSSSVVSSQVSVTAAKTGISNVVLSKEQAATNSTRSASKLDSKVTPAAAEAKIGLKSSDSQLRGNCPPVTCSSSATAAQPVIAAAKPAPLASSTGNTTPRPDSSKKPVAQKNILVASRDSKKEDQDNEDECDPALSEALGQFFSEGKDGPTETVKSAIPAKKTTSSTKFVPTIRTYAVKSMAGFSKDSESGRKNDSSGDNAKKSDANTSKVELPKKPAATGITIKVEKDDSISSGAGNDEKSEGKAGDPIAELSKILPPNLMKEITSGHPSKELLVKVADLLPAHLLKKAVEYLQGSSAIQQTAATETRELEQGVQLPGASVDATGKAKLDEEKSKQKAVDAAKKAGKPTEAPSRVQVIQPRKGLLNPAALGSTSAKGPVTSSSAKTPLDTAGSNKQPGTSASVVKPLVPSSTVPSKRKYSDIDPTKLKNLTFDEMLQLFQELLQDVLGGLFEEEQKPSAIAEKGVLDKLSVEDREMALKVRQMTGITDVSKIIHTMNVLKSLNSETIQALGQLDKSIIASSLTGNERAQKMGVTVLQQLTEVMAKGAPDVKQVKGPQVPVGRGRGSVRPPQPGLSSGRGVQSLLTLNFTDTPKVGALSAGVASANPALLPTPRFPQQPRFAMESMMASRNMGLLPTPPGIQNFPRPLLRKRGPTLQSEEFYSSAPPMKRWR